MKEIKRRVELFSFYDRTGLEQHLERMAQQGWLLDSIGQFLWTYRRIEPKKLTFSVCYFSKASAFDPGPSEEQNTFYDFCRHTGWTLTAASAQLQVFCNERPDPIPIETDPMTEIESIHRSVKRSQLPVQLCLLAVAVLNVAMLGWRLADDPISVLSSAASLLSGLCWALIFVLLGAEWAGYFRWRRRAVQAAERGGFYKTRSRRGLQIAGLIFLGIGSVYFLGSTLLSKDQVMITMMLLLFVLYVPGAFLTVNGVKRFMKHLEAPAGVSRTVTLAGSFVLLCAVVGAITFGTFLAYQRGWLSRDSGEERLPLTVEDLLGAGYDDYDQRRWGEQSFLLGHYEIRQYPRDDMQMPTLDYNITLVKVSFLYDVCKSQLLTEGKDECWEGRFYVPGDSAPWGAGEAYELRSRDGGWNRWLLCYPSRIVEIHFDSGWDVTPAQMALVGERLGQ